MADSKVEIAIAEGKNKLAAARRRYQTKSLENTLIRKAAIVSTAALYGALNRMNVPVAIGGFPWKLGVVTLATLGEGLTKGAVQAASGGIADSTMAIYIERSISTDTLIAGDDDPYDEDDDDDDDDDDAEI